MDDRTVIFCNLLALLEALKEKPDVDRKTQLAGIIGILSSVSFDLDDCVDCMELLQQSEINKAEKEGADNECLIEFLGETREQCISILDQIDDLIERLVNKLDDLM